MSRPVLGCYGGGMNNPRTRHSRARLRASSRATDQGSSSTRPAVVVLNLVRASPGHRGEENKEPGGANDYRVQMIRSGGGALGNLTLDVSRGSGFYPDIFMGYPEPLRQFPQSKDPKTGALQFHPDGRPISPRSGDRRVIDVVAQRWIWNVKGRPQQCALSAAGTDRCGESRERVVICEGEATSTRSCARSTSDAGRWPAIRWRTPAVDRLIDRVVVQGSVDRGVARECAGASPAIKLARGCS
jgi:hypothetical protein